MNRRGAFVRYLVALASASLLGCVSTSLESRAVPGACIGVPDIDPLRSPVVVITMVSESGWVLCSGVAIAPSLVLTSLGCVSLPVAPQGPNPLLQAGTFPVEFSHVDDEGLCRPEDGWRPLEDGTLAARFGRVADAADVTISTDGSDEEISVLQIFTARPTSLCRDDLALLSLAERVDVSPIALRLTDSDGIDDPVILSGNCLADGTLVPHDAPARIQGISYQSATSDLPPRALLLDRQAARLAGGGGVFSQTSGALLGIIMSGIGGDCSEADGETIALRLGPYRRMLLDGAVDSGELLQVEPSPAGQSQPFARCDASMSEAKPTADAE
jgi:hypothetical protein